MSKRIKITVVDDHELIRDGIRVALMQTNSCFVENEFNSGETFLENIDKIDTDIVLMDIQLPGISGSQVTEKALFIRPDLKIIALTMFSEEFHYMQMIQAGAKGFVLKGSGKYELQHAFEQVHRGGCYFSPEILQKLTDKLLNPGVDKFNTLTSREKEILLLVCSGLTSVEIAEKLFISPKTVEVHRSNIFSKLQVRNSAELIIWAIKNKVFVIN